VTSMLKGQLAMGMARVWRTHHQLVRARVAVVTEAVDLLALKQLSTEKRRQAGEDAHKLAGNLGTFGHPTGSEHARGIELKLLSEAQLDSSDAQQLTLQVRELQIAVQEISVAMENVDPASTAAPVENPEARR
jgi:HPt (histidine-containing phosphotransfer) domain-containing protein